MLEEYVNLSFLGGLEEEMLYHTTTFLARKQASALTEEQRIGKWKIR